MRLLLGEMLSPLIAAILRDRGHDVIAIKDDPLLVGLDDAEVLAVARESGRALVTDNLVDFRALHHAALQPGGPGHCGMVFIPGGYARTRSDVGRIADALEALLRAHPGDDDLRDTEAWV